MANKERKIENEPVVDHFIDNAKPLIRRDKDKMFSLIEFAIENYVGIEGSLVTKKNVFDMYGTTKQQYSYWLKEGRKEKARKLKYPKLDGYVSDIFWRNNMTYGKARIKIALKNNKKYDNLDVDIKTVAASMKRMGLRCVIRGKDKKALAELKNVKFDMENLVLDFFRGRYFGEKIYTDVTEVKAYEASGERHKTVKTIYFSVTIDGWNKEIIDWTSSDKHEHPNVFKNIKNTLEVLKVAMPPGSPIIIHSDHGNEYTMKKYTDMAKKLGFVRSMSTVGHHLGNQVIENWFGQYKTEWLKHQTLTPNELVKNFGDYVEYYNRVRIITEFGCSPSEYRQKEWIKEKSEKKKTAEKLLKEKKSNEILNIIGEMGMRRLAPISRMELKVLRESKYEDWKKMVAVIDPEFTNNYQEFGKWAGETLYFDKDGRDTYRKFGVWQHRIETAKQTIEQQKKEIVELKEELEKRKI